MTPSIRSLVAAAALASCLLCASRAGSAGEDKVKLTPEEAKILELTNEETHALLNRRFRGSPSRTVRGTARHNRWRTRARGHLVSNREHA